MSFLRRIQYKIFMPYHSVLYRLGRLGASSVEKSGHENDCEMLLVTIAYNKEDLIEFQIAQIRKHVKDVGYKMLVVDNSTKRCKRKKINKLCEKQGVEYVAVPRWLNKIVLTKLLWFGSSHGLALNWMYYHVLRPMRPRRFALLDHDLFPFRDCKLTELLDNKPFYGAARDYGDSWYLWAGFSIFLFDKIDAVDPDFLPVIVNGKYLDAGGGNFLRLYRYHRDKSRVFASTVTTRVQHTPTLSIPNDVYHGDCIQIIDKQWMHLVNGSNYANVDGMNPKTQKMLSILSEMENTREA